MTSLPASARHAPTTSPTYPVPITPTRIRSHPPTEEAGPSPGRLFVSTAGLRRRPVALLVLLPRAARTRIVTADRLLGRDRRGLACPVAAVRLEPGDVRRLHAAADACHGRCGSTRTDRRGHARAAHRGRDRVAGRFGPLRLRRMRRRR